MTTSGLASKTSLFIFVCGIFLSIAAQAQFYKGQFGIPLQTDQLRFPRGLAADSNGNIFVLDGEDHSISKYSSAGVLITRWGGWGWTEGLFSWPTSIATDPSGNVYVTDGNRVQKFNGSGQFISTFGTYGSANGEFKNPTGIALDSFGNIYVVDSQNSRIQKFNNQGTYVSQWGSPGNGDGQFSFDPYDPAGIAVDPSGNIFIADEKNFRIQKFSASGIFLTKWGSQGNDDNTFQAPKGLCVDAAGSVYVVDAWNQVVKKYTSTGTFISKYGDGIYGTADNQLMSPRAVVVDALSNVYITDSDNARIKKFSNSGTFLLKWGTTPSLDGQFFRPRAILFDQNGNLVIADARNNRIQKFTTSGTYLSQFGSRGGEDGQVSYAAAVAMDHDGNFFVADQWNGRIEKFSNTGEFLSKFGSKGSGPGQFDSPAALAIDDNNNVFVVDEGNHVVQKFSPDGTLLEKWGTLGSSSGQFKNPGGIAIDKDGNVYVADGGNDRIQKFTNQGTFIEAIVGESGNTMNHPRGIAFDKYGNIYIAEEWNHQLRKLSPSGQFLGKWSQYGPNDGELKSPFALVVDANAEHVYVADTYNDRIQIFELMTITTFPASGEVGAIVTINGSGFGSSTDGMTVKFNDVAGEITNVTNAAITVKVPAGATTGRLTVERSGFASQSEHEFVVLPLSVSSFSPNLGVVGKSLTITGTGFSSNPDNNSVEINGVAAVVTSATSTELVVTIPEGATAGPVKVTVESVSAISTTNITITDLEVSSVTMPTHYVVGEAGAVTTLIVNNSDKIQEIKFLYRGLIDGDVAYKNASVTFAANATSIQYQIPGSLFTDPIGMEGYFSVSDKQGNVLITETKTMYLRYPATSQAQAIPNLVAGKDVTKYQLISIPLQLTKSNSSEVFKVFGGTEKKVWRLFSYVGGSQGYFENPGIIEPGKGYWLIMRDLTAINPGEGTTVDVTADTPFEIDLRNGWNLIGNPYNFPISWTDVIEYNNNPAGLETTLKLYKGGFTSGTVLGRYEGAMVYSSGAVKIKIPLMRSTGGRKKSDHKNDLDQTDWKINFAIQQGAFTNDVYGFGMNPKASEVFDTEDELTIPLLDNMVAFSFKGRNISKQENLAVDVVNTVENYTWTYELENAFPVSLSWNNAISGADDKQLIIEDSEAVELINMRTNAIATFAPGKHQIKIHFGNAAYVKSQILREEILIGGLAPNPVSRTDHSIKVAVNVPDAEYSINMSMVDAMGKQVATADQLFKKQGREFVEWNVDFTGFKSGLYIVKINIATKSGVKTEYRKLLVD